MRNILKKKGDLTGGIFLIASIAAFAIFLIIVAYTGRSIAEGVKTGLNTTDTRVNEQLDKTINITKTGLNALWYIMFAGLMLGLFITAWFMETHPVFVPIFIILLVVSVILGVAMSNTYQAITEVSEFSTVKAEQGAIGFMMGRLPYIALIVGLISLVITFAKPTGGTTNVTPM